MSFNRCLCDWVPSSVNVGQAHRFIRLSGVRASECLSNLWETIQSDDRESTTPFFIFTFWSLYPLELSQHCATDRVDMLSELQPQPFMPFRSLIIYLVMFHIGFTQLCKCRLERKVAEKTDQWLDSFLYLCFFHQQNNFFVRLHSKQPEQPVLGAFHPPTYPLS